MARAKSLHPMKGDVGILGAYFNDEGINMMHDDWFSPMAAETKAILEIARSEAPDMTVSLHSHHNKPRILPAYYVPWYLKMEIDTLTRQSESSLRFSGTSHYTRRLDFFAFCGGQGLPSPKPVSI